MESTRPKDTVRSYTVHWNKNKPEVRGSNWEVGYTPAHQATPAEALAHAGVELLQEVANLREKWVQLQLLGAHLSAETLANAFGQMATAIADASTPEVEGADLVEEQYDERS